MKRAVTFARFEKMALALPGVEAGSSYGTPGLKVKKKFMARLREPDVLVLTPVYEDEQRFLIETQPQAFFLTPHYVGWPTILIRLSKVDRAQLDELLEQSWRRLATPKLLAERDGRAGAASTRRTGDRPTAPTRSSRTRRTGAGSTTTLRAASVGASGGSPPGNQAPIARSKAGEMTITRPIPQADEESREFYEGARRHELMLMRCGQCRAWRLPSRPRCPDCLSTDTEWARASGRGTLHSFGVMHQKFPGFEEETPYLYAVVELEEGPRIVSDVVGVAREDLRIDMPLVAYFDDVSDDTTLVRFTRA